MVSGKVCWLIVWLVHPWSSERLGIRLTSVRLVNHGLTVVVSVFLTSICWLAIGSISISTHLSDLIHLIIRTSLMSSSLYCLLLLSPDVTISGDEDNTNHPEYDTRNDNVVYVKTIRVTGS